MWPGHSRQHRTRNGKTLEALRCTAFEVKNGRIVTGKEHLLDFCNRAAFWARSCAMAE